MSVEVNATNFPDDSFRQYILKYYVFGGTVLTDEIIQNTKYIALDSTEFGLMKSLKGIEYFTNLEHLTCNNECLTELDLSKNKKLTRLNCAWNLLTELKLTANTKLIYLNCMYNMLSTLNLSNQKLLEDLYADNQIILCGTTITTQLEEYDADYYRFISTIDMRDIVGSSNISRVLLPLDTKPLSQKPLTSDNLCTIGYMNGIMTVYDYLKKESQFLKDTTYTARHGYKIMNLGYDYDLKIPSTSPYAKQEEGNESAFRMRVNCTVDPYMDMYIFPDAKKGEQYREKIRMYDLSYDSRISYDNSFPEWIGSIKKVYPFKTPTTPVKFSIVKGKLPTGLTLNSSTGVISGTPK